MSIYHTVIQSNLNLINQLFVVNLAQSPLKFALHNTFNTKYMFLLLDQRCIPKIIMNSLGVVRMGMFGYRVIT